MVLILAVPACGNDVRFVECEANSNCNLGPSGLCEINPSTGNKWCSYPCESLENPPAACTTGRCWSDFDTGDGIAGTCQVEPDAGTPDATANTDALVSIDAPLPDAVLPPSVTQVAAGYSHTCALFSNGRVKCWGAGSSGQLGYGNTSTIGDNELPSSVGFVDVGGNTVEIAVGDIHTCARLDTGAVRCWGQGVFGQLGYGSAAAVGVTEDPAAVGPVALGAGPVRQIEAGTVHTCAVKESGLIYCWGCPFTGVLGYSTTDCYGATASTTPVMVGAVSVGALVVEAARLGGDHTCARVADDKLRCWGANGTGQLGYPGAGVVGDNEHPSDVGDVDVGEGVLGVATGATHTCAWLTTGGVRCWGDGQDGKLGYGNTDSLGVSQAPSEIPDVSLL